MSSRLSFGTIRKIDNILDKELESLGQFTYTAQKCIQNEKQVFSSSDKTTPVPDSQHSARRDFGYEDRSNRVKFHDLEQSDTQKETPENLKMQLELHNLQSKVLDLERKLSFLSNSTQKNEAKTLYNSSSIASIYNTADSTKINSRNQSPSKFSYRTTAPRYGQSISNLADTCILEQDQMTFSKASPDECNIFSLGGSSAEGLNKIFHKPILKISERRNFTEEYESDFSARDRVHVLPINNTPEPQSLEKRTQKDERYVPKNYEYDVIELNKQFKVLKRKSEKDRTAIIRERIKSNELVKQIERLTKKMNRLNARLEIAAKNKVIYSNLIESFDKSEKIRFQQRNLIEKLRFEIKDLKGDENTQKNKIS